MAADTTIDFADLRDDGTFFELLVQDLLFELGYQADRTGTGTDGGVDLIAEKSTFDEIAGPLRSKYIVQCKHYAHSGRLVGRQSLEGISIVDIISQHSADGYLLVTTTDLTSSLREYLDNLNDNLKDGSVTYWDPYALERKIKQFPALV